MSEDKAQRWLENHPFSLPAVDALHRQAVETLRSRVSSLGDLADVIALDPGMTVALFRQVNSQLNRSGRRPVGNVHSALSLLGESARADLVLLQKTVSDSVQDEIIAANYHQLISRNYNLLQQLNHFISIEGIQDHHEVMNAGVLHNIGELCACLHDHELYDRYQEEFAKQGSDANSAKRIFGFDFHALGRVLCRHLHLGELLEESMHLAQATTRKAHLVQLAADISHQAEKSWYADSMRATQEVCSVFLGLSVERLEKECHQAAIEAARLCPLDDVLPAAARLIMLPDVKKPKVKKAEEPKVSAGVSFEQRMRDLLKKPDARQAMVLEELMDYLHDVCHLNRSVLMFLSRDRKSLGVKASRGLDDDSPLQHQVFQLSNNSLFRSILRKPAAVWIETQNYSKFEPMLSDGFKASFLSENFYLMSLFLGDHPVALLYCDRARGVNPLDKEASQAFKASVQLAGRALAVIHKRKAAISQ